MNPPPPSEGSVLNRSHAFRPSYAPDKIKGTEMDQASSIAIYSIHVRQGSVFYL